MFTPLFSPQDSGASAKQDAGGTFQGGGSMRAPKWLKRPCGAAFGFGGKIAMFGGASKRVTVADAVTDSRIVSRAGELSAALEAQDLPGFCERKAAAAVSERDRGEWNLMRVLCSQEQRQLLLGFLGVAEDKPLTPVQAAAPPQGRPRGESNEDPGALFAQLAVATEQAEQVQHGENGEAEPPAAQSPSVGASADGGGGGLAQQIVTADDPKLSRAVLNGNFEAAVERCMRSGRYADGLVLAASGGPELWTATRDEYLQSSRTPFMQTLSAIVHQDLA